jgi:hypothetical protein
MIKRKEQRENNKIKAKTNITNKVSWSMLNEDAHVGKHLSNPDYTLVDFALEYGGVVGRIVSLDTGEVLLPSLDIGSNQSLCAEVSSQDTARGGLPLSTLHITPFRACVEWAGGAGLLKVSSGKNNYVPIGGTRGKIIGFSFASRRRLLQTISKVRLDAQLPIFVTLTYSESFPSPIESKKHLDIFRKRLLRKFCDAGYIWKLEPQQRGAPHYHLLVWGCDFAELKNFVPQAWYEIAGNNDIRHLHFHLGLYKNQHCVSQVRSRKGVLAYASKYLGKTFEVAGWDEIYTGQFWGVIRKQNIPFGQSMIMYITLRDANIWMRYQKRFARLKSRSYKSLTTFCNSEQWISNIISSADPA